MTDLESETRHLRANRTPLDILAMIDNYAYDSDEQRRMFAAGLIATYGADCAAQARERAIQAAQEVVTHILATTVVLRHDPATYDGGKRVGASDVLSALINLD